MQDCYTAEHNGRWSGQLSIFAQDAGLIELKVN